LGGDDDLGGLAYTGLVGEQSANALREELCAVELKLFRAYGYFP
jgi:hypothetical protein